MPFWESALTHESTVENREICPGSDSAKGKGVYPRYVFTAQQLLDMELVIRKSVLHATAHTATADHGKLQHTPISSVCYAPPGITLTFLISGTSAITTVVCFQLTLSAEQSGINFNCDTHCMEERCPGHGTASESCIRNVIVGRAGNVILRQAAALVPPWYWLQGNDGKTMI